MENNIKKINTIGKVLKILLIIGRIALGVTAVITILLGIFAFFIPDNAVTVKGSGNAELVLNYEEIPLLKGAVKTDEIKFDNFGLFIDVNQTTDNDFEIFSFTAGSDNIDFSDLKYLIALAALAQAIVLVAIFIAAIFAQKFAAALAVCNSPFEENVIKRMKYFGYSLIPWAVANLFYNEFIISALIVLVILIVSYVFQYGAQLQQEADDTV